MKKYVFAWVSSGFGLSSPIVYGDGIGAIFKIMKRTKVAVLFVSGVLASLLATSAAVAGPVEPRAVLATPEQLAAEKIVIALLADPAVKAQQAKIRDTVLRDPAAKTPEGRVTLNRAIELWTAALIFQESTNDPAHPKILWTTDNTPHSWYGQTVDGSGVAGDNPDHIYRNTYLDGSAHYEITGKVAPNRPAQFSFEVTHGSPGAYVLKNQTAKHADMGNQIAILIDPNIKIDADGSFRITVDNSPANGQPNHLRTEPGLISVTIRDVLSDWNQTPNRLEIRRLDGTSADEPLTQAEIRRRTLADLPNFIAFWSSFKNTWFGGLKANTIVDPVPRDGGWGYQSAGRYDLAPDEVAVITTQSGGAAYTGVQVTDAWMIAPDSRRHQAGLNSAQVAANPDGSVTYVIGPKDPGVANWIDTAGLHHGYFLIRWEAFPKGAKPEGLQRSFKIVKLHDLEGAGYADLPRVTAAQRHDQLVRRAAEHDKRLTE